MSEKPSIPADIMEAAEDALDNLLCNCRESCGSTEAVRAASIEEIAKAILAERNRHQTEEETSVFNRCING